MLSAARRHFIFCSAKLTHALLKLGAGECFALQARCGFATVHPHPKK
jgi:hypothetical protein